MDRRHHARSDGWLTRRRGLYLLLALLLGLGALLAYSLYSPFQHPRTHLVLLTGGLTGPARSSAGPMDFVLDDFSAFLPLEPVLYQGPFGAGLTIWGNLRSRDEMRSLGDQIAGLPVLQDDVLLVYVSATGIAQDGTPFLVGASNAGSSSGEGEFRYPLRSLLQQIQASPARHQLLILDAGRRNFEPRQGMMVNPFPRLLREEVEKLRDDRLTVLCSHDEQQHSHLSPALRRSVFAHFVSQGLSGGADFNGDRVVSVGELHRYVAQQVGAWVQGNSGGRELQTPFLARWSGGRSVEKVPLLATSSLRATDPRDGHRTTVAENWRESQLARSGTSTTRGRANRLVQAQIERVRPRGRFSQLARYYLPQLWRERSIWFPGGEEPESADDQESTFIPGSDLPDEDEWDAPVSTSSAADTDSTENSTANSTGDSNADSDAPRGGSNGGGKREGAESSRESAGTGAAIAGTAPAAENGETEEIPPVEPQVIERLLWEVWSLRDRLETSPTYPLRPQDYAPQLWRRFQQELLAVERQFRSGPAESRNRLETTLTQWQAELQQLESALNSAPNRPTTLLQRLRASHPSLAVPFPLAPTLAMKEWGAEFGDHPIPDELRDNQVQLDRWLDNGERQEFNAWVDQLPRDISELAEFRLAIRLRACDDLDWTVLQSALRLTREAEQIVTRAVWSTPWLQRQILNADLERQAVQRRLLDQTDRDHQVAGSEIASVLAKYREIDRRRQQLEQARALRNDLLFRFPDYVQWLQKTPVIQVGQSLPEPRGDDLKQLLGDLTRLSQWLDQVEQESWGELDTLTERLRVRQEELQRPLEIESIRLLTRLPVQAGDSWQMGIYLDHPLARADSRRRLVRTLTEIDRAWAFDFLLPEPNPHIPPAPRMAEEDWQRVEQLMELQAGWLQLAVLHVPSEHPLVAIVDQATARWRRFQSELKNGATSAGDQEEYWKLAAEFGGELRSFQRALPGHLQARMSQPVELDFAQASVSPNTIRPSWWRLSVWLDPREGGVVPDLLPALREKQFSVAEFYLGQFHRVMLERIGQNSEEFEFLTRLANQYSSAIREAIPQMELATIAPQHLQVRCPTSLSLVLRQESEIEVTVTNRGAEREAVWLLLDSSDEFIEARRRGDATIPVYRPHEISFDAARRAVAEKSIPQLLPQLPSKSDDADVEHQPDSFWQWEPSLRLRGGETVTLRLRIRRRSESRHSAQLLLGAFSTREATRWSLPIQLPAPRELEVRLTGNPSSWSELDRHWQLHPYPNRISRFQFSLRGPTERERKVEVKLYVPPEPLPADIPAAMLPMSAANEWLRDVSLGKPIAEVTDWTLPGDGQWQVIPWQTPEPEPDASAPGGGAGNDEVAPVPAAKDDIPVRASLLMVVTDLDLQRRMLTRFDVAPQKPSRYLRPQVSYDPSRQRLEVEITPLDRELLPSGAVRVRAEMVPELPEASLRRLDTLVEAPRYRGHLFAELPAAPQEESWLFLHVDDYPRAFAYRVGRDRYQADIPQDDQGLRIHVQDLPNGTVYRTPVDRIPVELSVDAPRGAFQSPGDFVEVGLDRMRNRLFTSDRTVRLGTDRRVRVTVPEVSEDGFLSLATEVTDLRVELTETGHQSGQANVLARLMVGGREVWSDPVEIVLDGSGPRFLTAELTTDDVVAMGSPIGVIARVDDRSLSGVARVEMAIDQERSGKMPEERIEAELDGSGAWRADVPTDGISRGAYNLLVQATDRVGNRSDVRRIRIQLVSEEDLKPSAPLRGEIRGTVLFGRQPREAFPVTLEKLPDENGEGDSAGEAGGGSGADSQGDPEPEPIRRATRTDANGLFIFRDLPPGTYQIQAAGIVHNRPRSAETTVKLSPPEALSPVELVLP
jgi:hypothetical protein